MVTGAAELRSALFSNHWSLISRGDELARIRRFPKRHMSVVRLADGTLWTIEPARWGLVRAVEDGRAIAEIERLSWWGRQWEVRSPAFALPLVSRPAPRRWYLAVGAEPVAELAGSMISYNRLRIDPSMAVPVVAVVLAWQVVCRPWEAAAYPVRIGSIERQRVQQPGPA
jgi:hypothetical protein